MNGSPLPVRFFRLDSGREPVRSWLKGLSPEDRIVLLHGFVKKSTKTPTNELALAKRRLARLRH